MTRLLWLSSVVVVLALLPGCEFLGGGGGFGGGSGAGGGAGDFTKGYVGVRKEGRNLSLADVASLESPNPLTTDGAGRTPSLSKDGKTVVYSRQVGQETSIVTVPSAGGTPRTVLTSTGAARNLRFPVFSPNGQQIAFTFDEGATACIGVVNTDGSGFLKVAGGAFSYVAPSFTPEGTHVLVAAGSSAGTLTQLEKVSLTSGTGMNLASSLGAEAQTITGRAVLSPDGTKAAFDGRLSSGVSRIFVIDLASKQVHRLTDYPADQTANDSFPTWVGNDKVGFSSDTGGNDNVYALPASSMKTSGGLQVPGLIEAFYGPN